MRIRIRPVISLFALLLLSLPAVAAQSRDAERDRLLANTSGLAGVKMRAVDPAAGRTGRIHALSSSSFDGFVHCPAELGQQCTNPFGSIPMVNNTAYFRDVIVGAYTSVSSATDGETWAAVFTDPAARAYNFPGFTFHSNFNGNQDCFVSPFQVLCGTTSIEILWYLQSQCQPAGTWQAQFTNTTIPVQTFEFKSEIEGFRIPLQRQSDYPNVAGTSAPNPYDETCKRDTAGNREVLFCPAANPVPAGQLRWSIAAKGCFMTDVSMVMTYHGFGTNPSALNGILVGLGRSGFDTHGNVVTPGAIRYARGQGVNISFPAPSQGTLATNICRFGPQLVRVPNRTQHWVTAYGVTSTGQVLVRDPSAGQLASIGTPLDTRLFSGPAFQFNDQITGMRFTFHSPVEAFITDPTGRRAGFDPLTQTTYNEIPNAFYDQDVGNEDDETGLPDSNPGKTLEVYGDVDGDYLVTVTGTDTATYDAEIWAMDLAGNMPRTTLDQIPTAPGLVQTYLFHFERADASQSSLGGGFDGGGQRPRDVNKFLTYGNPAQTSTTLPAGTTSFPLVIFYASNVLPASFSADLNGINVAAQFHPAAGTSETVTLTLAPGRNVLKLSADGQLPTRVATDSDRLVLQVP